MSIYVTDYAKLIETLRDRQKLDPEHLRVIFLRKLSYRDLVEMLCDYINACGLLEHQEEAEDLGRLIIDLHAVKQELETTQRLYARAQSDALNAEKKYYQTASRLVQAEGACAALRVQLSSLQGKLALAECSEPIPRFKEVG